MSRCPDEDVGRLLQLSRSRLCESMTSLNFYLQSAAMALRDAVFTFSMHLRLQNWRGFPSRPSWQATLISQTRTPVLTEADASSVIDILATINLDDSLQAFSDPIMKRVFPFVFFCQVRVFLQTCLISPLLLARLEFPVWVEYTRSHCHCVTSSL